MKEENDLYAELNSPQINTVLLNAVRDPARRLCAIKVKRITRKPREPVYNMEVDEYHNFPVNDGLIVHNSIDCVRYAMERVYKRKGQ